MCEKEKDYLWIEVHSKNHFRFCWFLDDLGEKFNDFLCY